MNGSFHSKSLKRTNRNYINKFPFAKIHNSDKIPKNQIYKTKTQNFRKVIFFYFQALFMLINYKMKLSLTKYLK